MNIARPKNKDFAAVDRLESVIKSLFEYGEFPSCNADEEGEKIADDEIPSKLGQYILSWWNAYEASWFRVVFGGKTAIENACDPNSDILEFNQTIKTALAQTQRGQS